VWNFKANEAVGIEPSFQTCLLATYPTQPPTHPSPNYPHTYTPFT